MKAHLVALALLAPCSALAWHDTGHRLVGEIAWRSLSGPEQAKVQAILDKLTPKYRSLQGACVLPDDVKRFPESETGYKQDRSKSNWHYFDKSVSPGHEVTDDDGQLMRRLPELITSLTFDHEPTEANALKLAMLGHLVGDIHQPLHTSAFYLPETAKFDRGGNDYKLQDNQHNLHYLWDALATGDVDRLVEKIMRDHPEKSYSHRRLTVGPEVWADESWKISKKFVYSTPRGQKPSQEYMDKAQRIAYDQIALAGYRLAETIKTILKGR
ncbi:MAG: S1/P1 nuclease [Fimbriimonadaceae bacterium]|nr:S1/P1 nuclease [Fimbriimonadaceae bacterium]